jgi:hypothetical protein
MSSKEDPPDPPFARGGVRGSLQPRTASPPYEGGVGGVGPRALACAQPVRKRLHAPQRDLFVALFDFALVFTFANGDLVRGVVFVALIVVASGSYVVLLKALESFMAAWA